MIPYDYEIHSFAAIAEEERGIGAEAGEHALETHAAPSMDTLGKLGYGKRDCGMRFWR